MENTVGEQIGIYVALTNNDRKEVDMYSSLSIIIGYNRAKGRQPDGNPLRLNSNSASKQSPLLVAWVNRQPSKATDSLKNEHF